jgi:endonuclease/exonuclease/phosphatase family metal-dependent hydrolase
MWRCPSPHDAAPGPGGGPGSIKEEAFLQSLFARTARWSVRARISLKLALAVAAVAILGLPAGAQARTRGHEVKVMTRNIYLGADLTDAVLATSTNAFVDVNGQIVRDVDENDFPTRAKGLASEILKKKPDLVGLQEVSLWRKGPLNDAAPFTCSDTFPYRCAFTASTVTYDYLKLLLNQLNQGHKRYAILKSKTEFDFEAPTDRNGVAGDGDACPVQCDGEENDRLTMRDVILKRLHDDVKVRHVRAGTYHTLYSPTIGGAVVVHVQRGWESADVKVGKSPRFRVVNTHLEAFDSMKTGNPTNHDSTVGKGEIRKAQAKELVTRTSGRLPVILLGDLNSDDDTVRDGDRLAYRLVTKHGFRERSTDHPLGCCISNTNILTVGGGGHLSDFDHQVDHILTDSPRKVKLVNSSVTGRQPVNGFWDSDHAGLFSTLRVR